MTQTMQDAPLLPALDSPAAETPVRYIKLGAGGSWVDRSLDRGEIHFGHRNVPHELALRGDRTAIVEHLVGLSRSRGSASAAATEILTFYQLGPETIWITFERGCLWWARAAPGVVPSDDLDGGGRRYRKTIGRWSNKDARGDVLRTDQLSSKLTMLASFPKTICRVEEAAYVLRKIAGNEEPVVTTALARQAAVLGSCEELIAALHWRDFETLVDLILNRGGWHRTSRLGGTMADADLLVEQVITGERASVQVKSSASQAVLDDYIERFDENGTWQRLIFACHSPEGELSSDRPDVIIWTGRHLAEAACRNGLFDWLIEKVG